MKRRQFLQRAAASTILVGITNPFLDTPQQAEAQTEIAAADAGSPPLMPFKDPLSIPGVIDLKQGGGITITMKKFEKQLHSELKGKTTVWGYNEMYPGPTIEAQRGKQIQVIWKNELPKVHLFDIDYDLDGVPKKGEGRDVRTVVHLHGIKAGTRSDGYPTEWFLPDGKSEPYTYPNDQPASTLWYHDHALGITRLNVQAGLAGFYLLRDKTETDDLTLPKGNYEIPLLIQDRTFKANGQFDYQGIWRGGITGDTAVVNGTVWPYHEVEPRKYRLRLLNGSNTRTFTLSLADLAPHLLPGPLFIQIGGDGGFLPKPAEQEFLEIAPAERFDVIVDFSKYANHTLNLVNADKATKPELSDVMQFRVTKTLSGKDTSEVPTQVTVPSIPGDVVRTRIIKLTVARYPPTEKPTVRLLLEDRPFNDPIVDYVKGDTTEIWELVNTTSGMHPMHIHLIQFQVMNRQAFNLDRYNKTGDIVPIGPILAPPKSEAGLKDTVKVAPFQITRVKMRFPAGFEGNYVFHCHILEHEDNDMMRPFEVIPSQV